MADFNFAFPILVKNEGGYSNHPNDRGGETYIGIARNLFPNWIGWEIVDMQKPLATNQFIKNDNLDAAVKSFYYNTFWLQNNLEDVNDNAVASHMMDIVVNHGSSYGGKIIQRALNDSGQSVAVDGSIGNKTILATNNAIRSVGVATLNNNIAQERIKAYQAIVQSNPSQSVFLPGWLKRAGSFISEHPTGSAAGLLLVMGVGFGLYLLSQR